MFRCRNILFIACASALLGLIPALSAKPPAGGGESSSGTIYYYCNGALYSMTGDGGQKQVVAGMEGVGGERGDPSRLLHGGRRWFLSRRPAALADPLEDYPEADVVTERYELYAISTDGTNPITVQLTDDISLRPEFFGPGFCARPRWLPNDEGVSFKAVQWYFDELIGEWIPVEAGIYTLAVTFDANGYPRAALDAQPELCIPCGWRDWGLNSQGDVCTVPKIREFDWNPDASAVVCVNGEQMRISPVSNPAEFIPLGAGWEVCWSPDGTKVAFFWEGAVQVMDADGRNRRVLRVGGPMEQLQVDLWSPDSKYLLCFVWDPGRMNSGPYVCRLSVSGEWKYMTSGKMQCGPIGWR